MDFEKIQKALIGISTILISSGLIKTFKTSDSMSLCTKTQLNLGLASSTIAGILMTYQSIRH